MTITIYTSPDGQEFRNLPRTWNGTTNITERWALAHGWTKAAREVAEQPVRHRYSKYRLHRALAAAGIWEPVWNALKAAGYEQYWNDAQELASDDEVFAGAISALEMLISSGDIVLPEEATVESLLQEAQE